MPDLFFGGGINQRDDFNINAEECIEGQNFLLDGKARTFRPRLPFDLFATMTNGSLVSGIMQLIKRDNTDTLLVTAGNTAYSVSDAGSPTSVGTINTSTGMRSSYYSLDDKLVITDLDLANVIYEWDGSTLQKNKHGIGTGTVQTAAGITRSGSTATLTATAHGLVANDLVTVAGADQTEYNGEFLVNTATTDTFEYTVSDTPTTPATGTITIEKSVDLYAKYSLTLNGRTWLFNIKDVNGATTTNPHMILVSEFENKDSFDIATRAGTQTASGLTGNEAFFMLTPDLRPINGVVKFYNTIIISTVDGELFRLTGSSAADYEIVPFYPESEATGRETMVESGNDITYIKKGGDIDTVSSTDKFGDIKADDLSRFIPTETNGLSDAISVYHQRDQRVFFFITDKILVLDKNMLFERPEISPWTIYKTQHPNNFNTCAASYIRKPGGTEYDVYFGDSSGKVYKLKGTLDSGDEGTYDVLTYRKSRLIYETSSQFVNQLGKIEYRRKQASTCVVTYTYDESGVNSSCSVPLQAALGVEDANFYNANTYWGEDKYWDEGVIVPNFVSKKGFSPAGKGQAFFVELRLNTSKDFLINRLMIPNSNDTQR